MADAGDCYSDWQFNKSLVECNQFMLDRGLATDISFLVGLPDTQPQQIKAHKYMLASRSPVFFAMLCGELQEDMNRPIEVPDVEPEAFRCMLIYLYTDIARMSSDTVLPILYISKKYLIPALTNKCFRYLEENLGADNVCLILEQSILYDEANLTEKCAHFVQTRTNEVIKSLSFKDLSLKSLMMLLKYDNLTVSELELFTASCSWAVAECNRQSLEPTPLKQRQVLGEALFCLHFPAMSLKDFSKYVSKSGLLLPEERCAIFEYLSTEPEDRKDAVLKFPIVARSIAEPTILRRFSQFYRTAIWSGDSSTLRVMIDKPVVLKGFGFSGSMSYDPVSEVQIIIKQSKSVVTHCSIPVVDNQSGETIQVTLPSGVVCKAGLWYTINLTMHFSGEHDQGYCRRGKAGSPMVICDDITFEFDKGDAGFILDILFCQGM